MTPAEQAVAGAAPGAAGSGGEGNAGDYSLAEGDFFAAETDAGARSLADALPAELTKPGEKKRARAAEAAEEKEKKPRA